MRRFISLILIFTLLLCGCSSSSGRRRDSRRSDDNDRSSGGFGRPAPTETEPAETTARPSETAPVEDDAPVYSFALEPIMWDTATLGQVAVPAGFSAETTVNCCDDTTCLGYPLRVSETLISESADAMLFYKAGELYMQRVSSGYFSHNEGALDQQLYIFMKTYETAPSCCDEIAALIAPGAVYVGDEDMSNYQMYSNSREEEYYALLESGQVPGMTLDWSEMTAAQRLYSVQLNGVECAICVLCEVKAYQITTAGYGFSDTSIFWDIPGYYVMVCPMSDYEENHDNIFQVFIDNTKVNDEFVDFNEALAGEISSDVINNWNMQCAASSAYASAMTAMTFASVESNMNYGTYSSDQFSDYIFDQNDYTLSDGSSVQISTSYDYVYEGDNGVVYYSNSAFTQPGGSTQLYPN